MSEAPALAGLRHHHRRSLLDARLLAGEGFDAVLEDLVETGRMVAAA